MGSQKYLPSPTTSKMDSPRSERLMQTQTRHAARSWLIPIGSRFFGDGSSKRTHSPQWFENFERPRTRQITNSHTQSSSKTPRGIIITFRSFADQ